MAVSPPFAGLARDGSLGLIWRLVRENSRDFARQYLWVVGLGLLVAGTTALNAWLVKDFVDQVFFAQRADLLYLLTGIVVAAGVVRGFSLYGSAVILGRISNAVVARCQRRMFDHFLDLGMDYYNRTPSSDMVNRMTNNANDARIVLQLFVTNATRDFLTVAALVVVMFVQNWVMSLILLVIAPIAIVGVVGLVKRVRRAARDQFTSLGHVISDMQETARGIRIVKAFNLEPWMRERMRAAIDLARQRADRIVRIRSRTNPLMEILGGFAVAAVILYAGYQSIHNGVPPGAVVSFIAAIVLAYEPAKRLAQMQINLEAGLVGVRLMYELLDTPPTMDMKPDGPALQLDTGEVTFEDVAFSYTGDVPQLEGLNFTAAGGATTALVGPSGAGKSTIIALIERFFDVSSGRILIDGQDISTVRLASLRDHIALVSQDTVLFRGTIRENIRFGRPDATDAEIEQAAKDAMAHDFIVASEHGYDTMLGDQTTLSGGQRQRIAIARALLRDARIILLDEATSSLDSESERQVQIAFEALMRGRTTIVIAHRLSTVQGAARICVLVEGRIVEEGRHADLLAAGGVYARLYHLQFAPHDASAAPADDKAGPATEAAE